MTCEVCDREECQRDRFAEPWDAATMAEVYALMMALLAGLLFLIVDYRLQIADFRL